MTSIHITMGNEAYFPHIQHYLEQHRCSCLFHPNGQGYTVQFPNDAIFTESMIQIPPRLTLEVRRYPGGLTGLIFPKRFYTHLPRPKREKVF